MSMLIPLLCALPAVAVQDQAPAPDRAALEAAFARRMTGATLKGYFSDDTLPAGSPLEEDSYVLKSVTKLDGDTWRIEAGVEYGGRSFAFPIQVDVLWAGDTPMISLTDLAVPLIGTFTARVVFHGERYAGIWDGAGHGGAMFGRVIPAAAPEPAAGDDDEYVHWPSFRGRDAGGLAEGWPTPAGFDLESGENVLWRVAVPGLAHSSPVIWGDRLYLTTAIRAGGESELTVGLYGSVTSVADEGEHEYAVLCFDKRTGAERWRRQAWKGVPHFPRHPKGSFAASTPATDGAHVVAFFGTEGLYCYDGEGELLWKRDFGPLSAGFFMMPEAQWGFASSPIIHGDRVIVQCDVLGDSFVSALDLETGEELWATPRDDVPTWSTPTVFVREGRAQVLCNGFKHAGGYDLETGAPIWWLGGGGDIPVPTPIVAHDTIFLTSAHGMLAPIYAIEGDALGELSMASDQLRWSQSRRGNYMQTPLVYGQELYCCRDNGAMTCYDATTGEEHYAQRVGDGGAGFTASPVAADGKLYFTSEAGDVHAIAAGTSFEELAASSLGEETMATPAISEGVLYWRTRGHLIAVGLD